MKLRNFVLALILSSFALTSAAQNAQTLNTLEGMVISLRDNPSGDRSDWDRVIKRLSEPDFPLVALLDNLVPDEPKNEYHRGDADPFRLNGAVVKAFDSRRNRAESKGDFYNSLTRGVNYSMIEKTIAAGKSVNYTLDGHKGSQLFVVIPFSGRESTLDIRLNAAGSEIKPKVEQSQINRFSVPSLDSKDKITIKIENTGKKPQAFVIINYNSKK